MSTLTCAGRRPAPCRDVTSVTKASARSWSNDRPLSGLAPLRGDRRVEGGADHGVGFRVQREVGVAHPGLPVGPAAQRPLRPQPLGRGAPVALEPAGEIGDVTFERIHRRPAATATNDSRLRRPAQHGPVRRPAPTTGRSHRHARPPRHRTPTRRAAPATRHTARHAPRRPAPPRRPPGRQHLRYRQPRARRSRWWLRRRRASHGPVARARPVPPVLPDHIRRGRSRSTW